jgi:hypothetical protein
VALEVITCRLPFWDAESILPIANYIFQYRDERQGEIMGLLLRKIAQDIGGNFDHGIEHTAAEVS